MSTVNDGGSAFPIANDDRPGAYPAEPGMSLRDWFAGQMLAGFGAAFANMVADDGASVADMPQVATGMASVAYTFADAMIVERSKP